ncbi:MAG: 4Fe-4S dicluster domain-containing protein [Christensenellaceae bacterium]|nr:4Fe-4S dicluster domain-containing protein [Christensenellaceae bacterium]
MNGKAHILRFDPAAEAAPHWQDYEYTFSEGETALDVLNRIFAEDPSLYFEQCCKNLHCGICGAVVNGRSCLLCREPARAEMTFEPLRNFPVKKDLAVLRNDYEDRRKSLRLFLERRENWNGKETAEPVNMEQNALFKKVSRCIECYCCVSECPVFADQPHAFWGPAALMLEARHIFDPRDELSRNLIVKSMGAELCVGCGACDAVCPHSIPISEMIEKIQQ